MWGIYVLNLSATAGLTVDALVITGVDTIRSQVEARLLF